MNNINKLTMAACILALVACSDDSLSGAAIEPSTMANNSSSSVASSSSISSSSNVGAYSIEFTTTPTRVMALTRGRVSVYGEEYGAVASCSAYNRDYLAQFSAAHAHLFEKTAFLSSFGSACDSLLDEFKNLCASGVVTASPNGACDKSGSVKAYCYLSKTDTVTVCSDGINCESKGPVSAAVFDSIVTEFVRESSEICDNIAIGIDTTTKLEKLPLMSTEGVDTSSNRSFIIKPAVESLNVSEIERAILDSLARAFPEKTVIDEFNGAITYDAARYAFTISPVKYYVGAGSTSCNVDVYAEEFGVMRTVSFSTGNRLENTILQYADSTLLYMVAGYMNSSTDQENVETLFRTECDATAGSFYNYPSKGMARNVAMACAVKNFSRIFYDAILGQQEGLCEHEYVNLVQPVLD